MASDTARDRLLDAAETLLRNDGLRGVSIRRVTAAAGVNVAAVNYEFGSKEELLAGLLERLLRPVTRTRLARFAALDRQGQVEVEDVVLAFVEPLLAAGSEHRAALAGLLRHIVAESAENLLRIGLDQLEPGVERFEAVLRTAAPAVPPDQMRARVQLGLGTALFYEIIQDPGRAGTLTVDHLVGFLSAALSAPPDGPSADPARTSTPVGEDP